MEPGARLAAILEAKLGGHPSGLTVVNSTFEDAQLEAGAFDLVFAATSFHWLDPATRYERCHRLLRPGGALAVVATNQIASTADGGFFARVQPVYGRYRRGDGLLELPDEDVTPVEHGELVANELFDDVTLHRHRWDQTYSSAQYADLVRTYSSTQIMEPDAQDALIADLCAVADREFGGSITIPLVITLTLGRKAPGDDAGGAA